MTMTVLAFALALGAVQTPQNSPDKVAIERVKNTVVRTMDSTLPDKKIETWLHDLFGSEAKIAWEANDCGEQTGDPQRDRGRDFPMCVDASVALDGNRVLHLLLAVGTWKTGVRSDPPSFYYGCVVEAGVPARWLKSLREAADIARTADSEGI
jgi:hypothetical protein